MLEPEVLLRDCTYACKGQPSQRRELEIISKR